MESPDGDSARQYMGTSKLESMGFVSGWGVAFDQLAGLMSQDWTRRTWELADLPGLQRSAMALRHSDQSLVTSSSAGGTSAMWEHPVPA